ncbi:hypothetical protein GCM10023116_03170 [Kistimonas scapharcae]|uniref:Tape measure protein N-terminal domain-containing protein n=1 Tax=Kistimonas scapharcae TaxID=1036133 RepID=A0ABP8UWB3_9GAMM
MARVTQGVMNIIIRAKDLAKGTLAKVTRQLRGMGDESRNTESQFSRLARSFRNLLLAGTGFYALKRAMTGVLSTGDQFERTAVQLKAVMGSVEEGEKAFAWIREFTQNTPLQLQDVTNAFVLLRNFGFDPTDGTMQSLVDMNAKLGGSQEKLQRITLQLGQAWGNQKLQYEEIKTLIENGVPVWDLLSQATGKNVTELRALSAQGKLGRDVIRGLIDAMGQSSRGAAADAMSLLSGYVSNLKDRWSEFANLVAESGWLDYIKDNLRQLNQSLETLDKNGKLKQIAQSISDTFIGIAESVKAFFADLTLDELVAKTKSGLQGIVDATGPTIQAFTLLGNSVKLIFNSITSAVNGLQESLNLLGAKVSGLVSDIAGAFGNEDLQKKAELMADGLEDRFNTLAESVRQDAGDMKDALAGFADAVTVDVPKVARAVDNVKTTLTQANDDIQQSNTETAASSSKLYADIQSAMDAIDASDTSAELADIGVVLARSYTEQKLSAEDYQSAAEKLKRKLKELKEAAKDTASGFQSIKSDGGEAYSGIRQSAGNAQSITGVMANHINGITQELHAMSPSAEKAFQAINAGNSSDSIRDTGNEIEKLKEQLGKARKKAEDLRQSMGHLEASGISEWFKNTAIAAEATKAQFLEQKITFEELMQAWQNGELTAQAFTRQASTMGSSLNLLNEADLSTLNNALAQAKTQMDALNNSTRNTLESLQSELDRLRGDTEAVEKRNFEKQNRELKTQLEEAREKGDAESINNLEKSLRLNRQVYNEKRRQINEEQRQQSARDRERETLKTPVNESQAKLTPPTALPATKAPANQSVTPDRTIRLEYPGGAVDIGVMGNDEQKLLKALERAGMRAI